MDPVALPANQPADRFYLGGARISAFRGVPETGPHTPEDWVGSTTTVRGQAVVGRTRLPDGTLLVDAIAASPVEWLGASHIAAFGVDTKLLVKLLDPGQRLPVHAHPHVDFAREHVDAAHGKAEAWYILSPGEVWLGLTRDVAVDELAGLVERQDVDELLELMHRIEVHPHDTVYVPPGVLHAIGEGVFLAEVQEPEDLSILLEWRDFALDGVRDGHLGIGFETALKAVETRARSVDEIAGLVVHGTLAAAAGEYFRLDRVEVAGGQSCQAGFAVLIGLEGELELVPSAGTALAVGAGNTVVIPHAAGAFELRGTGSVLLARPPLS